ncbi:alpha/beta hydrolase family protein [Herbihabitans rhizosphaerae]|uniref:Alpha/beta hydrolase family protein n=1 Tax=Herbihabitans rhizosphaerae TaxID=1872711 RepID=A0A4Q7L1Q5_9PSEU|nr:alpha/beta hydrolase [Herbihabitans rhizosphaerae]RZS43095.1 alpha/beta hydrolase family protein [Herbihabitans rhizosphaerae]
MPITQADLAARAQINPWKLLEGFTAGDPAEISNLASQFAKAGGDTKASVTYSQQAGKQAHDGYSVAGSPVPTSHVTQIKNQVGSGDKLTKIAGSLDAIADDLYARTAASKNSVHTLNAQIATWSAAYDRNELLQRDPDQPNVAQLKAANRKILADAVAATQTVGKAVDTSRKAYEQALAGHRRTLSSLGYTPPPELNEGTPAGPLPAVPGAGSTPQSNRAWWNSLTAQQRQDLIQQNPRAIGNLNGLPASARDAANRIAVKQDLSSADKRVRDNANAALRGLYNASQKKDPRTGEPPIVQLYAYDARAFGEGGRAAIAVGDIDKADNVVFNVPGIKSDGLSAPDLAGRAGDVYIASRNSDPSQSTAVIAWIGYDAPGEGIPSSEANAQQGAQRLTADLNGLRASRGSDQPHVTVVGHSYGSTVVARAGHDYHAYGPNDDIVLLGSIGPGNGITKASDLNVSPDQVHVGTARNDITINAGGGHGADPTSKEFGAKRIAAETDTPDIDLPYVPAGDYGFGFGGAHGSYFDPNSESLYNVGQIATGHGDSVIRDSGSDHPTARPNTHRDASPHLGSHDTAPHVSQSTGTATTSAAPAPQAPVPAPTNTITAVPPAGPIQVIPQRERVTRGME